MESIWNEEIEIWVLGVTLGYGHGHVMNQGA
jgi:hypothetical protein